MKKSVLLLLSFVFFSNLLKAQCPTGPECFSLLFDIANNLTFTMEPSAEGSCTYFFDIVGIPPEFEDCLEISLQGTPTSSTLADLPYIQQGDIPDIEHFNVDLSHNFNNTTVPYIFVLSIKWKDPASPCYGFGRSWQFDYDLFCLCSENENIGIELTSEQIDCTPFTDCNENINLEINNLSVVSIEWEVTNDGCVAPSISNGTLDTMLTFAVCEFPYIISVKVVDEFGCEYEDKIFIQCNCGIGCEPEPLDLDFSLVLDECFSFPIPNAPPVEYCFFDMSVTGAPPTSNYVWEFVTSDGITLGTNGSIVEDLIITPSNGLVSGSVHVFPNDPCFYPDSIFFEFSCPEGCDNGDNGNGNGENVIGNSTNDDDFKLTPNPVGLSGNTVLNIQLGKQYSVIENLQLDVMDLNGRKLESIATEGQWSVEFDMGGYLPGMYLLALSDGKQTLRVEKFVVSE